MTMQFRGLLKGGVEKRETDWQGGRMLQESER